MLKDPAFVSLLLIGHKELQDPRKLFQVNFGYIESGEKKNALVKLRLCTDCSTMLNYHSKKRKALGKKEKKAARLKEESPSVKRFVSVT